MKQTKEMNVKPKKRKRKLAPGLITLGSLRKMEKLARQPIFVTVCIEGGQISFYSSSKMYIQEEVICDEEGEPTYLG